MLILIKTTSYKKFNFWLSRTIMAEKIQWKMLLRFAQTATVNCTLAKVKITKR
jgi:hypothetical protein